MQQPIVAFPDEDKRDQFYFNVGDKPQADSQIIVTYPVGMRIPTKLKRRIELLGSVRILDLGGDPRTKQGYKNEVLSLHSWKYID